MIARSESCMSLQDPRLRSLTLARGSLSRIWAIYKNGVYDLTDYLYTADLNKDASGDGVPTYAFLDESITTVFKQQPGQDITKDLQAALDNLGETEAAKQLSCMKQVFYLGDTDFRLEAKCTVQNWLLLAFSIIMMSTVVAKCKSEFDRGCRFHLLSEGPRIHSPGRSATRQQEITRATGQICSLSGALLHRGRGVA